MGCHRARLPTQPEAQMHLKEPQEEVQGTRGEPAGKGNGELGLLVTPASAPVSGVPFFSGESGLASDTGRVVRLFCWFALAESIQETWSLPTAIAR